MSQALNGLVEVDGSKEVAPPLIRGSVAGSQTGIVSPYHTATSWKGQPKADTHCCMCFFFAYLFIWETSPLVRVVAVALFQYCSPFFWLVFLGDPKWT
jgi:hypothetical protein